MSTISRRSLLARDTCNAFESTGWAIVPQFFSEAEVRQLGEFADELESMPERSHAQMLYREASLLKGARPVVQRIEDFCPHHTGLDALLRAGHLFQAIEELFNEEALLFKDKINFKAPGGAGFEAHQDQQAGWTQYAPLFITALVCIDRATIENGCLEIAKTPRLRRLIGQEWSPLTAEQLSGFPFTPVPTEPGDVIFFDSFVAHSSQPNLTQRGRRVLYATYNRAADGDHRARYFADKRASFPPDIDREPGVEYKFRV